MRCLWEVWRRAANPLLTQVPVLLLGAAALYALITRNMRHQDAAAVRGLGLGATQLRFRLSIVLAI